MRSVLPSILLFGAGGQLGTELRTSLAGLGDVVALGRAQVDFLHHSEVRKAVQRSKPRVIVNTAAFTDVDGAEREPQKARRINSEAVAVLAEEARAQDALLVHYSTDYVFDGQKEGFYKEDDPVGPLNVYGETKLEGEQAVEGLAGTYLILRTSWVYSLAAHSFVGRVLDWARQKQTVRIVTDQFGSPTWARGLAQKTAKLLAMAKDDYTAYFVQNRGLYHLAGQGRASRYVWTKEILDVIRPREDWAFQTLEPALSDEFPSAATRPANSALSCALVKDTFGLDLPSWQAELKVALAPLNAALNHIEQGSRAR